MLLHVSRYHGVYLGSVGCGRIIKCWNQPEKESNLHLYLLADRHKLVTHLVVTTPIALSTDETDLVVGVVLEQFVGGSWQILAFFSHQLCSNEQRYSTFDRELLALYLSVRHFCFMSDG
ncbi:hypothetical protein LDENG_00011080 [Lucifuga dentata]|nr:hypothetical protein LDENG_00011080 [Lucifuga dentata]